MNDVTTPSRTRIDLAPVFAALDQPIGLIADPERAAEARRFAEAARVHQERAVFDLLAEVVSSIDEMAPSLRVRLEYEAGALHLALEPAAEPDDETAAAVEGDLERVTIRVPANLKVAADAAAAARGISLNKWYNRIIWRALYHQGRMPDAHEAAAAAMHQGRHGHGGGRDGPIL